MFNTKYPSRKMGNGEEKEIEEEDKKEGEKKKRKRKKRKGIQNQFTLRFLL